MSYTKAACRATSKYVKEKQKTIAIRFKKDEYEQNIKPEIEKTGLSTATYIKQAIKEKIERDKSCDDK